MPPKKGARYKLAGLGPTRLCPSALDDLGRSLLLPEPWLYDRQRFSPPFREVGPQQGHSFQSPWPPGVWGELWPLVAVPLWVMPRAYLLFSWGHILLFPSGMGAVYNGA